MQNEIREYELKKSILLFFDRRKFLESIEAACGRFSSSGPSTLYSFVVDVDIVHLLEEDSELCEFILKQPRVAQILFQEVIYTSVNTLQWLPTLENIYQLLVAVKITSLPPFPEFRISRFQDLRKCPFPQYYQLNGIIVAQTTPSVYTQGSNYVCPDPTCEGSSGCKFFRVRIPGARERLTIRNDLKCSFCQATLKENVKARVLSEKLVAEMVPIDGFSSNGRHQSVPVYFKGSMIEDVKLGSGYSVIGLTAGVCCLPSSYEEKIHLEADHGWPITFQGFELKERPSEFLESFRSKMESKLREKGLDDATSSPYVMPLVISYYFGDRVVAKGLFHNLKLGILLSLAMCGRAVAKGNLSLLAVGGDSNAANRLLTYGRSLAPRTTAVTDQQQLKVSVSRDGESDRFRLEANPVLLASGGICCCGDLDKFNVAAQRTVARMLETNSVEVDNVFRGSSHGLPQKDFRVECQVWAYASRHSGKRAGAGRIFKNSGVTEVSKLLLDAFSIIFYTDSWSAFDNDHKDAVAMLSSFATAMDLDESKAPYTHDEIQTFLRLVQRRDVAFETDAEELINGYYVVSRRLRNSAKGCVEIAITAVASISLMAEAHARLSLRLNVIEADAIAAIFLYEEYLTSRFGSSCFNVQPFPHLLHGNELEDCKMVLEQLETFAQNLRGFVSAYGEDFQLETVREE